MNKQKQKLFILGGVGAAVLGTGACQQTPPADTTSPPVTQGPAVKPGGVDTTTGAAPSPTGVGGAPQRTARGGDPFAPGGTRPGGRKVAMGGRRPDPFFINWKQPVPPPYVFDEVEPIRLASDFVPTPPPKPYEVREQPQMRVSGIMTGDGAFAILERPDGVDVVKPGSTVEVGLDGQTKRTYKVVSITKDAVKLRSQVGNVIYTQDVPLSDVAVGAPARTGGFGGPPGAGGPGSFGGGPPRPGSFGPGGGAGSFGGGPRGGKGGGFGAE